MPIQRLHGRGRFSRPLYIVIFVYQKIRQMVEKSILLDVGGCGCQLIHCMQRKQTTWKERNEAEELQKKLIVSLVGDHRNPKKRKMPFAVKMMFVSIKDYMCQISWKQVRVKTVWCVANKRLVSKGTGRGPGCTAEHVQINLGFVSQGTTVKKFKLA